MKQRFVLAIIFILTCSFFCFINIPVKQVFAQESEEIIVNDATGIYDEKLYNSLLWNNYNKHLPSDKRKSYITKDMFNDLEHLELSDSEIQTLVGLELLEFPALKSVNLSNNNITSLYKETAILFENIEKLDISHNSLNDINNITYMPNLTYLDVSYNNVTAIDLSSMKENNNVAYVNMLQNKIKNTENIILSSEINYEINLIANYINQRAEIENAKIDYFYQRSVLDVPLDSYTIKNLGGYSYENFTIEIYANNELINSIDTGQEVTLNVGNYVLKFLDNQSLIYNESDLDTLAFKDYNLKIMPTIPTVKYYKDGKEFNYSLSQKNFGEVTLKISSNNNYKIKVSRDGINYVEQNEITLADVGKHEVFILCEDNGVQSKVLRCVVYINDKLPLSPILISLLAVVMITLIFWGLKYYANKPINFNKKMDTND